MSFTDVAIIAAGALIGGFVSGLAGFGMALAALGIWLHAVPPILAAPLAALCSCVSQITTIRAIWHAVDLRRIWPMVAAGVVGVPIGAALLAWIQPDSFRLATGVLLIVYSLTMLASRGRFVFLHGGRTADALVGFGGGILGGLAGLSGALPTMWAALRGWGKDHSRSVFQLFNLTILATAFADYAIKGLVTREFLSLAACAIPGTILGAWLGAHAYRRLSDIAFRQIVLGLLGLSGVTLVLAAAKSLIESGGT